MAIKPPAWAKATIPTLRGWVNPRTNERVKNIKISQADIDEYMSNGPVEQKVAIDLIADVDTEVIDINSLTKAELVSLGIEHGLELDIREKKTVLIDQLKAVFFHT